MRSRHLLTLIAAAAIFAACSEAPTKVVEKAPEAPPEPVTGSTAFFRMYTAARGWAGDLQPLRMTSIHLPDVKKIPGKAARAQLYLFGSGSGGQPAQGRIRRERGGLVGTRDGQAVCDPGAQGGFGRRLRDGHQEGQEGGRVPEGESRQERLVSSREEQ